MGKRMGKTPEIVQILRDEEDQGKLFCKKSDQIKKEHISPGQNILNNENVNTFLNHFGDGLIILNDSGEILEINHALYEMVGYSDKNEFFNNITSVAELIPKEEHKRLIKGLKDTFQKGFDTNQFHAFKKDKSQIVVDIHAKRYIDSSGKLASIVIVRDVTEKKKAENKLKERIKELTCLQKIDNTFKEKTSINDICQDIIEFIIQGMQFPEITEPYIELYDKHYSSKTYSNDLVHKLESKIIVDGGIQGYLTVYYRENKPFILPEEQNLVDTIADHIGLWIEQKESKRKLKQSEKKYRFIFEKSPIGISTADKKGRIIDIDQSGAAITGHSREELIGKSYKDLNFIDRKTMLKILKDFPKILKGKTLGPMELKITDLNGNNHILEVQITPLRENGKFTGTQVTMLDVTERKKAERDLRNSEKKYHTLFDTMAQGVVYQDAGGEIISANPAAQRILGLSLDQMQGRTSLDPRWKAVDKNKNELPGEKHPAMISLKTGKTVDNFIQGIFNPKKNDYVWIIVNSSPQFKKGADKPYQVYSTFLDITKQMKAEELFRTLVEQSTVGVYIHDPVNNKILYANPLVRSVLGFSNDEIDKVDFFKYLHPDDVKLIKNRIQKNLSGEKVDPSVEVRIFPPDSKMRWIRLYSTFIDYQGKKAALASIIDITDSKEADDKVKKYLDKLEKYRDTTVGRELRVVELKKEINKLCREQGIPIKYKDTENALKNDRLEMEVNS
ncbi:PAS domain S-box protein [Candidatus Woesearchaeota archaeon]|nr:PAS domain S-box protein [Candidatus Woesearchaeota archaeon]